MAFDNFKRRVLAGRVEHGVKWLDGHFGREGWLPNIEKERLDLAGNNTCMLGQLFGRETQSIRRTFNDVIAQGVMSRKSSMSRGFLLSDREFFPWVPAAEDYATLTQLWIDKMGELNQPPPIVSPIQAKDVGRKSNITKSRIVHVQPQ